MRVQGTIQKWGNSLALRITGPIKTIPKFKANMQVNIDIEEDGIQIHPIKKRKKKLPFSEKDLLKGMSADSAHADELAIVNFNEFGE